MFAISAKVGLQLFTELIAQRQTPRAIARLLGRADQLTCANGV